MGLTGWIRAHATPRPLLVTARGGREVRLAVERSIRKRGWDPVASPAEADLLIVCGAPGVALADAVARVWAQLPSPRARADIHAGADVDDELDRARARLADPAWQRADPAERPSTTSYEPEPESPAGPDTGGVHDMHMMHGGEVAGLPMADRAPDRDGLTLDVLHVTLGPVLTEWPAGLMVQVRLQGDVVQSAQVEVVGEPGSSWDGPPAAVALDSLARLLAVCGASTAARTARRLRDGVLADAVDDVELRRFAARLRRSRTLRWATDGVGSLDDPDLGGDATDRWRRWVDVVEGGAPAAGSAGRVLEVLPGLLEGRELGAARVLVASFDPDLDAVATVS